MIEQSIEHVQIKMVCSMDGSFSIFYLASDVRIYVNLCLWRLIG